MPDNLYTFDWNNEVKDEMESNHSNLRFIFNEVIGPMEEHKETHDIFEIDRQLYEIEQTSPRKFKITKKL